MSSSSVNIREYFSSLLNCLVVIETSSSGVFQKLGQSAEPAWAFNLWKSSLYLASYIEKSHQNVQKSVVIELGAGTGLISILCTMLGAKLTISTDMCLALPLINHNAKKNLNNNQILSLINEDSSSLFDGSSFKCLKGHHLTISLTESDEYVCNICEDEIPESADLYSCRECDFDCCKACCSKISDPHHHTELPHWLQCKLELSPKQSADEALSTASNINNLLVIAELDWNDPSQYDFIWRSFAGKVDLQPTDPLLLIASDVTYNYHAVTLFFSVIDYIVQYHSKSIVLLFAHHRRSVETTDKVFSELERRSGRWSYETHHYDTEGNEITGKTKLDSSEVIIFKVYLQEE